MRNISYYLEFKVLARGLRQIVLIVMILVWISFDEVHSKIYKKTKTKMIIVYQ